MRLVPLVAMVRRELRRSRRTFVVSSLGIAVGVGTLTFFLALGAGMRDVVLRRIFPIDRIEVAPATVAAGAVGALLSNATVGITPEMVLRLRAIPGVAGVLPKMRLAFPNSGRGGHQLLGRDIGLGELVAEGIDPSLVLPDLPRGTRFVDNSGQASRTPCRTDNDCHAPEMCDVPLALDGHPVPPGVCAPPLPAVVSPYLVEIFDGAIAPAHHLPPVGALVLRGATGLILEWDLGRAGLGLARQGQERRVHAQIVGASPRAIDIGITIPLDAARRLNREFAGDQAAEVFSSVMVQLENPNDTARVTADVRALGLDVRTTGAEQMGLLVAVITAILSLTSVVVVVVAALNIAQVFATLIAERRGEIGLYRALGATRGDIRMLVIAEAATIGLLSSIVGVVGARGAAVAADWLAAHKLPVFPFKPEHWFVFHANSVALTIAFGIGACVLCALAPASRAARIEPATALAGGV